MGYRCAEIERDQKVSMAPPEPPRRFSRAVTGTAAVALVAAVIGGGAVAVVDKTTQDAPVIQRVATPAVTPVSTVSSGGTTTVDFSKVYASRRSGLVSITSTVPATQSQGDQGGTATAGGSGVIIDEEGHVLTNEHVVDGASKVQVELASGTTVTAKVVGTDKSTDVALLDIDVPASQLDPVPLGDSSKVVVGQPVLAIGDPFGYQASASAGIVSGLDRSIEAPNGFTITGAIQTDAAVNHGNSGGALLNAQGELIGIPSQIADSGVNANVGVAFAVPVNTAKTVVASIEKSGDVEHAWLGVSTADVDANLAQTSGVGADKGALITGVTGSGPAAKAGLTGGNKIVTDDSAQVCVGGPVVTALDDTPIESASDLQNAVDAQQPGATVTLKIVDADGTARAVRVTLGTRPASAQQQSSGATACG